MDQIKGVFNGNFDSIENIKISPFSRAYTFSDSIYEVVPFYKSNIIAFNLHMQRLFNSAEALNININIENIEKEIKKLISSCETQSGYVYYQVTRGVDSVRSHMYSNSLEVETFGYVLPFSFKSKSLRVMICEDIRWGRCDIKSTSLLGNVMSMNSSQDKECDEVIMHKDNVLTEAGASNVFFTKNDVICTPKLSKSILPGITRSLLIDELNKAKIPIIEGVFSLEDLSKANAVWLTSSTKGISLVDEIINLESTLKINDPLFIKSKSLFDNKFFS
jgi:D-alanine transaminase